MKTDLSKNNLLSCFTQFLSWLFPSWNWGKPAEQKLTPIPVLNKNYRINKVILFGTLFCFACLHSVWAHEQPVRNLHVYTGNGLNVTKLSNTLPLTFILLNVQQKNGKIGLKWIVNNEENTQSYLIEKSTNGLQFTAIGSVAADVNKAHIYYWENNFTSTSISYFRVKSIDKNGSSYYSPTVTIAKKPLSEGIGIFPNMVEGSTIRLLFNNQPAGNYSIRLIGYSGQQFFKKTLIVSNGFQVNNLDIPFDCYKGNYLLEIINPTDERQLLPLVVLKNN